MEALFKFWALGKCLQCPGRCAKVCKKEALALKPHSPEWRHPLGCRLRGQGTVCRIRPRLKERQSWTCAGRVAGPLLGAPSPSLS